MSRFGFSTEATPAGDFLPIVKYDAKAGRMFRMDRAQDSEGAYVNDPVEISSTFKAIVDFENVETGWVSFAGAAPDFRLVPLNEPLPPRPAGKDDKGKPLYNNVVRVMLKLGKECGGDKPIRELAGTSKAFLGAFEKVFVDYEDAKTQNPGKLPIITMKGATPVTSGPAGKKSTNYIPTFELVGWAPRGDLVFVPKGGTPATSPVQDAPRVPPSTGSTVATPPKAVAVPIAGADADDDFG